MKILFLNYEYPPLGGGAGNATSYLLKEYAKMDNLEVDLVTSSFDKDYHLEKIGEKINIHKLPIGKNQKNIHFQSSKDMLTYLWKAYFFSQKLIREKNKKNDRYDISHSFFTIPCGFISLLLKWQYKIPYIISLRGSDVPGYNKRFSQLYKVIKFIVKIIWSQSKAVIANSEGLKTLALETNPQQKISVIYNGIDISEFIPKEEMRPKNKFILTSGASRITSRKGIIYLIEAIKKLLPEYPNLFFRVIGEGDEKTNLETITKKLKLEKNIEFVGNILHEETPPFYQEASLFILPSFNEGMSNAMLEALSAGLPLLATDTGGTRELIDDGINGFIIKMKDSTDIAEKIKKLIDDPELRQKMAEESRKKALEMGWEKVAKKYADLYESK